MRMKVSVATVTYNHEAYIAQTIESVLMQEGDFDIELIIGEDCSTDRTLEIVRSYESKYPSIIRVIASPVNLGGQRNIAQALDACTGKYVAILDGDDYWISPQKLATQVKYMEENPGCAVCSHNTQVVYDDGRPTLYLSMAHQPGRSELADILRLNFIASCTVMYRWGLVTELPPWWDDVRIGDLVLHALHARYGWIGYIDEVLSAYRMHAGGSWSIKRPGEQSDAMVEVLCLLDEHFEREYHGVIQQAVFATKYWTASTLMNAGQNHEARQYMRWCLSHLRHRGAISRSRLAALMVLDRAPALIPAFVRLKALLRRALRPGT